jgi:two-component system NtrC family sensor kinase
MKKIIPAFFILLCIRQAYGQDQQTKKLQQQLKEHTQADTFRVNRLNELGQIPGLSAGKLDTVANEAYDISKKISYIKGEGYALINLVDLMFLKSEKQKALSLLQQAFAIAEKTGDKTLLAFYYLRIGKAYAQTTENKQALAYTLKAESIAQTLPDKKFLSTCQRAVGSLYQNSLSDYPKGMEWTLKSTKTAEDANCLDCLALAWTALATLYNGMGEHVKSLYYYKKALEVNKQVGNKVTQNNLLNAIGERYRLMGNYPEAIKAYEEALNNTTTSYNIELNESNLADVYVRVANLPMAFKYGFSSLKTATKIGDKEGVSWIDGVIARAYLKKGNLDSALYYATQGLEAGKQTGTIEFMRDNFSALANAYALKKDFTNAYKYQNLYITYRDSMINTQVSNQTNLLQYNNDIAKKQAQIATLNQDKQIQRYFLTGAFILVGIIALTVVVLLKNNRQKQKANNLLSKQKHIIEEQRDQTNKALADLQLTQKQLIQSEKMASLGELTAGIAHEIQNPLNFVNNFSEVNIELIDEMELELSKGDKDEAMSIAGDIKQNLEKIRHHGKRADGIVKGMLQHSRASSNTQEPTDINVLADEYLRLAYHGLRAKDKSFNADLNTNFADKLPMVNIVPQDIGRALLNLFNNAFYTVSQKQKTAGADYKPEVSVSTSAENEQVIVKVRDKGNGIPDAIKDKIMQPFFTTKPTGEGTGLGLSLTYDMVVKGHGGSIQVNSVEGEGSEFIIQLPIN